MKIAANALCLMSRMDYDKIGERRKEEIKPFYDAFQDSVQSVRLVSGGGCTTIEILAANTLVEDVNKLLWYGIHDLVSPGNVAYVEIHNFDQDGNTIDIEKYIMDSIVMSVVKNENDPQTIKIAGAIAKEITIQDSLELEEEDE
jgi:hypothetical protein